MKNLQPLVLNILLVFMSISVYSQVPQPLAHLLANRPQTIAALHKQMAPILKDTLHFLEREKNIDRTLTFGVKQVYYSFFSKKQQLYELSVLAKGDNIFCLKVFAIKRSSSIYYQKIYEEVGSWLNPEKMQDYIGNHNQVFGTQITLRDTFLLPIRLYNFGGCGGIISWLENQQDELISSKDTLVLQQWLRSMNVELQAYAIEGLAHIKHPEKIKKLQVQEIRKSERKRKILQKLRAWRKTDQEITQWLKTQPLMIYHCVGSFGIHLISVKRHLQKMGF